MSLSLPFNIKKNLQLQKQPSKLLKGTDAWRAAPMTNWFNKHRALWHWAKTLRRRLVAQDLILFDIYASKTRMLPMEPPPNIVIDASRSNITDFRFYSTPGRGFTQDILNCTKSTSGPFSLHLSISSLPFPRLTIVDGLKQSEQSENRSGWSYRNTQLGVQAWYFRILPKYHDANWKTASKLTYDSWDNSWPPKLVWLHPRLEKVCDRFRQQNRG